MTDFAWHAIDTSGRERRGHIAADTPEDARMLLEARRLYVVAIDKGEGATRGPSLGAQLIRRRRRLSTRELTLVTRQFASLVTVIPVEEALRTIAKQTGKATTAAVLGSVHDAIVQGHRLADALATEPQSFPPLYRAIVAAGEASGTLPEILERLADLHERQASVRGKLITALAYPTVLAVVATTVVLGLMLFVVPRIVEQFDISGRQLPLITRIVVGASELLVRFWWIAPLLILIGLFAFARLMADEGRRLRFDTRLLGVPLIGRLLRDLHAARMARTLSSMVESRLPLIEGIAITARTVHNRALRSGSEAMVEDIRGGSSLSAALRRTDLFPPIMVYMAASGEASGRLDEMLERAADYLEREFDMFTATLLALLEPLVIVFMGVIVALIVLSILLPVLQLDTLAGM